jgi:hypothetical protein
MTRRAAPKLPSMRSRVASAIPAASSVSPALVLGAIATASPKARAEAASVRTSQPFTSATSCLPENST